MSISYLMLKQDKLVADERPLPNASHKLPVQTQGSDKLYAPPEAADTLFINIQTISLIPQSLVTYTPVSLIPTLLSNTVFTHVWLIDTHKDGGHVSTSSCGTKFKLKYCVASGSHPYPPPQSHQVSSGCAPTSFVYEMACLERP